MELNDATATPAETRRLWVVLFAVGVLLALTGLVALIAPNVVTDLAVLIWGWFLVIRGVLEVVGSFFARKRESFLLHLLTGILALVVGVLVITHEEKAEKFITLLIAVFFLFGGLSQVVAALLLRSDGWLFTLIAGLIGVVVGVAIWRGYPDNTALVLGICIGVDLIARGGSWIGLALSIKNAPHNPSVS
jgi:uncharacterized membrane protein HdeD (DUF308 family)